jgi:hypothetical protein
MNRLLALSALAAALALPALAQAQTAAPRQCVSREQLRSTKVADDSTINARVGKDIWQIKMVAPCSGLRMSRGGYVLNLHAGQNRFCGPIDFDISINDPITPGHCLVDSFRKLTPAEVAAIAAKDLP